MNTHQRKISCGPHTATTIGLKSFSLNRKSTSCFGYLEASSHLFYETPEIRPEGAVRAFCLKLESNFITFHLIIEAFFAALWGLIVSNVVLLLQH